MPLYVIERRLSREDGGWNWPEVRKQLAHEMTVNRCSPQDARKRVRRSWRFEMERALEFLQRNLEYDLGVLAQRQAAEHLAASCGWDPDVIRGRRDIIRIGTAHDRHVRLPLTELALELAIDRQRQGGAS